MVQKMMSTPNQTAKRGRPRAYDPDVALTRARDVFWEGGFAATSLDDLSQATGMNRPSLYAAFGDKRALYGKALEEYRDTARQDMKTALASERPLRHGLRRVYDIALSLYFSGAPETPRGCFLIGTAVTEAVLDPGVRAALEEGFQAFDEAFETRLRYAREQGELRADADPALLAKIASAALYFLAIRSRTGEKREVLEATANAAIDLICGVPA
ncbi:transcriptional regulator, TetR family [Rhizobiales bacterium GAS188]|nr:transcriptional regulator, TetR family [Rhizobiales bacterium GAS188]